MKPWFPAFVRREDGEAGVLGLRLWRAPARREVRPARASVTGVPGRRSHVRIATHRFWEAAAILAGLILVGHALAALVFLQQPPVFVALSVVELGVGAGTICVDAWFLRHV